MNIRYVWDSLILCATLSGYFNISIDPPFMMYLPLKLRNENLKSNSLTLLTYKNKKDNEKKKGKSHVKLKIKFLFFEHTILPSPKFINFTFVINNNNSSSSIINWYTHNQLLSISIRTKVSKVYIFSRKLNLALFSK